MARKQSVRIVAVVEDRSLDRFVWHTLKSFGFSAGKVDIREDYPRRGAGSGKQYVEDRYCQEIVTFRQKSRENVALLLGTEADEQSVGERTQELDDRIAAAGRPPRHPDERIVYWIPKHHVETWGLHLTGTRVDEVTLYKKEATNVDWPEAGRNFVREYRKSKLGEIETLDSLKQAYRETGRLNV